MERSCVSLERKTNSVFWGCNGYFMPADGENFRGLGVVMNIGARSTCSTHSETAV